MDASINLRVPQSIKDRLEKLGESRLLSLADVARAAFLEKLERDEPDTSGAQAETQPATTEAAS